MLYGVGFAEISELLLWLVLCYSSYVASSITSAPLCMSCLCSFLSGTRDCVSGLHSDVPTFGFLCGGWRTDHRSGGCSFDSYDGIWEIYSLTPQLFAVLFEWSAGETFRGK